ncbi:MAG: NrdH-redoxin [Elusimicrobia bacterium GWA2_62_23]|nr:MAG: NrdH-redoxin [Elusimicrobia bacterium GWA2_62_23]OGR70135.1 MAG: NrdH-redoxin [Elusimicrobia bacterium GWC2_63_65]
MKKVIVYALTTCLWCKKTKKFFEEKKVPFEAVDYDKQPEEKQEEIMAEMKAAGCTGSFPFVKIGGACVQGYDPDEFEKLLEKK